MVTIVWISMLIGGVIFTSLDIFVKHIYFGPVHMFTLLTGVMLFLHLKFQIAYSNFFCFFLFIFWISFLCLDGVDEDETNIYFVLIMAIPAIVFDSQRVRYLMGLVGLIALIIVVRIPSFQGVSDHDIVGIYDFIHIMMCSIIVFVVLNYFRRLIDSYSLSQTQLLENTKKLNESLGSSNERLSVAKNDLVSKNEELETFVYVTSHDLKSPLNSILGFQKLLKERLIKMGKYDELSQLIEYPLESAQTLKDIIDNLLVLSRSSNNDDLELSSFKIYPLFEKISIEQNGLYNSGEIEIEINSDPSLEVHSNKESLYLIIQNLVSNGIHYNESAIPKVSISVTEVDSATVISIQDNGIGIDEEYFDSIFEPFKRLNTLQEAKGTGLGLAIVQRLIAKIGADISLDSTKGVGSTFEVILPNG